MNITNRAAIESSCKFIEDHIASRSCDSDGISSCWRCNSVYLAKRMREFLATQPPQDERGQGLSMDTMQAIYAKAWSRAADWANRHDLHSDIGSPAYLKDMAIELAEFADVAAAPPVALSTLTDERIHPNRQFSMIGKQGEKLARLLDEDQWAECEAMLLAIEHGPWQNLAPAASMDEYSSECLECGGTGMRDSGGFQPWGEAASVPCDCGGIQAMADRIRSERAVAALVASAPAQQAGQGEPTKTALAIMHELLETTLSEMPSFDHGKEAQEAWADRRAKARNDAAAFIAAAEIGRNGGVV